MTLLLCFGSPAGAPIPPVTPTSSTTGATSARNLRLYCASTADDVWLDLSGHLTALDVTGGDVVTDHLHIVGSDRAVVRYGKRTLLDVGARIVYTEVASEAPQAIDFVALKRAATPVRLVWAPRGVAVGNLAFMTDTAYLYAVGLPGGDVADGTPIVTEFRVKCRTLSQLTITSTNWPADIPAVVYGRILTEAGDLITTEAGERLLQEG